MRVAPDAAVHHHAVVGVAARGQRGLDLVERHLEALRHGRRGQGVRHQVPAGHRTPRRRVPHGATSVNTVPPRPSDSICSARTVASFRSP